MGLDIQVKGMKEKEKTKLPPIKGRSQSKERHPTQGNQEQEKGGQEGGKVGGQLPKVNYFYISGRYKVCRGGFYNAELNDDYSAWLSHRRHVSESLFICISSNHFDFFYFDSILVKQQIDNQGMSDSHIRYSKFRQRIRKTQNRFQKSEIDRHNQVIYSRVKNAKTDLGQKKDPWMEYVENSMKKRREYGRYLDEKKLTRENTLLENRVKAAKPWATVTQLEQDYEKLMHKGRHFRKFKNYEDYKVLMKKRHEEDPVVVVAASQSSSPRSTTGQHDGKVNKVKQQKGKSQEASGKNEENTENY